jgi:hypothetical protein
MNSGSYFRGDLTGADLAGSMLPMAIWEDLARLCNRFRLSPETVIDLGLRKLQNEANSYGSLQAWEPEKPKEAPPLGGENLPQVKARGSRKK